MMVLKNIKMNDKFIECDYFPEGNEPSGFMRLKISDGEIDSHIKPEGKKTSYGSSHVRDELERLAEKYAANIESLPSKKTVMWY